MAMQGNAGTDNGTLDAGTATEKETVEFTDDESADLFGDKANAPSEDLLSTQSADEIIMRGCCINVKMHKTNKK